MCTLAGVFVPRLTQSEEYECLHSMMGHCSSAGFLVTGGLGGLGLLAAAQIQKFVCPSLSLISRSRSVSRGLDILDMMHTHESVALVRCDISKAHRTSSLMCGIHQQSVSTIGLVHASGTQALSAITDQRPFRFE
jgi:short-subunit dehydrogenase